MNANCSKTADPWNCLNSSDLSYERPTGEMQVESCSVLMIRAALEDS